MASGNVLGSSTIAHSEQQQPQQQQARTWIPDERDALIAWLRGEFAAANAIIDALCQHLQAVAAEPGEYDHVLACIHQRRCNWNPVLHMQQYYSVAEVLFSLKQVAVKKQMMTTTEPNEVDSSIAAACAPESGDEKPAENGHHKDCEDVMKESAEKGESSKRSAIVPRCISGFEEIGDQQVNVMEGMRVYDDLFDTEEAAQIAALVSESHAGKKKNSKGNKRSKNRGKEVIHFGTLPSQVPAGPVFKEETAEPMPGFLESVIDRLVKLQVIPASKRPDSCSISVLDAGDYMPPHNHHHFEQPIMILSLGSASALCFGRNLKMSSGGSGEIDAKYKVTLSAGSVLVLQGNSVELVQCAVPALQSTRTLVTFGIMPRSTKLGKGQSPKSLSVSPRPLAPAAVTNTTAPVLLPVTSSPGQVQPVVLATAPAAVAVASSSAFPPLGMVATAAPVAAAPAAWSNTPPGLPRVPSPGTGVFLPAAGSFVYNSHHQAHRRHQFDAGRKAVVA